MSDHSTSHNPDRRKGSKRKISGEEEFKNKKRKRSSLPSKFEQLLSQTSKDMISDEDLEQSSGEEGADHRERRRRKSKQSSSVERPKVENQSRSLDREPPTKEGNTVVYYQHKIKRMVTKCLLPYKRDDCIVGKITSEADFQFLSEKYTKKIFDQIYRNVQYNKKKLNFDNKTAKHWWQRIDQEMIKYNPCYVRGEDEEGDQNSELKSLKELNEAKKGRRKEKKLKSIMRK